MKILRLSVIILFSIVFLFSCNNDSNEVIINQVNDVNTDFLLDRNEEVNVVHNGETISIRENELLNHLKHGDKMGTLEDNVVLQSIVLNEESISYNDPLYVAFRNSEAFDLYNQNEFGILDLERAEIVETLNARAIAIPVEGFPNRSKVKGLVGYILSDIEGAYLFNTIVISSDIVQNSSETIGGINFGNISGEFSFFEPNGSIITTMGFLNNDLVDVDVIPTGTCYSNCVKRVKDQCSNHLGCEVVCGLINIGSLGFGWTIGIRSCCAIDCGLTGQSHGC